MSEPFHLLVHDASTHDVLLEDGTDADGEDRDGWVALLPQELHQRLQRTQGTGLHHHALRLQVHLHQVREIAHHLSKRGKEQRDTYTGKTLS